MRLRALIYTLALVVTPALNAAPREFHLFASAGQNPDNWHGHSFFRTLTFELTFDQPRLMQRLQVPGLEVGASVSYHDIRQPHSWFGHTYEDLDDSVRGESMELFVRHVWRPQGDVQPFADLGTGPMWSNRRVPAATSRLNFNSQLGIGAIFFARSRWPLMAGYRFAHVSNGGSTGRNPGLDVHLLFVGTTLKRW
jgi:hypothetical protein